MTYPLEDLPASTSIANKLNADDVFQDGNYLMLAVAFKISSAPLINTSSLENAMTPSPVASISNNMEDTATNATQDISYSTISMALKNAS